MLTAITHRRLWIARIAAVSSFIAYVCSHIYVLSLHGPHPPQPYSFDDVFVIGFFIVSALLNILWLRQLFFTWDVMDDTLPLSFGWDETFKCSNISVEQTTLRPPIVDYERDTRIFSACLSCAQIRCLPYNIAGNIFLVAWGWAWIRGEYLISQILLSCNLAAQLYAVFVLLHVDQDEAITPVNSMTHHVMKTGTGLGVLLMLKNWGVFDTMASPSTFEMLNFGVICVLMTVGSGPDPTLGLCLLYDLISLLCGNTSNKLWHHTFLWSILAVTTSLLIDLMLSKRENFSWLKGFDSSFILVPKCTGQITLEKDVDLFTNLADPTSIF
ncbi:hypothetical protein CPB84DRAFT_1760523 [Gymnopilus junonius]|uniref:Uncharacterized protein n=1 Tax=Gymnopilus junonius TaxID=109634 RepID=A0A9P5P3C4_GYMJU|nr:hypothetical protein CPB84DRAFT_1760523 [Gymnopilus junonius]